MSKCYDNPEYDDTYSDIQNTWNQHPKVEQEHETKVMKNLHILPTDKPSRLACDFDKLILNSRLLSPILYKTQNIYITSNEEIKEGFVLLPNNEIVKLPKASTIPLNNFLRGYSLSDCKKIILTTDQDLIKDGVQAIDDDFLEWFVKNPSCEEVKILRCPIEGTYTLDTPEEELKKNFYCGDEVDYDDKCLEQCDRCVDATGVDYGYLPKEKPKYPIGGYAPGNYMCNCSTCKTQFQGDKRAVQCEPCAIKMIQEQNIIDMMKGDEELGLYDEIQPEQIWNEEKKKGIKQLIQDHKQETLKEAAEREYPTIHEQYQYDAFIEGAKWQKDQYTIEEQHIERSIGELEKEYIKGFNQGSYWQQERSYSEEEVLNKLTHFAVEIQRQNKQGIVPLRINEWFERNKNK